MSADFDFGVSPKAREYLQASEEHQALFNNRLRREIEAERAFDCWQIESDQSSYPLEPPPRLPRDRVRWSTCASGLSADDLTAIPAAQYVSFLLGHAVQVGRSIHCPLPGHEERSPSFQVYPGNRGWYCFGCHRGGSIYNFAGYLWELSTRGREFKEIQRRLTELFL